MHSRRSLLLGICLILTLSATSQQSTERFEFSPQTAKPLAKELMKEDFFWSPIDESGPFGSDGGSDAAYGFYKWRKTHPALSTMVYLKDLIASWNYPPFPLDELDTVKIKAYMTLPANLDPAFEAQQIKLLKEENDKDTSRQGGGKKLTDDQLREIVAHAQQNMGLTYLVDRDEAIIGTAFAQFVLEGKIDATLKYYAGKAIQRKMLSVVIRQFGQPDQQQAHNTKMKKLLLVVKKMPS